DPCRRSAIATVVHDRATLDFDDVATARIARALARELGRSRLDSEDAEQHQERAGESEVQPQEEKSAARCGPSERPSLSIDPFSVHRTSRLPLPRRSQGRTACDVHALPADTDTFRHLAFRSFVEVITTAEKCQLYVHSDQRRLITATSSTSHL